MPPDQPQSNSVKFSMQTSVSIPRFPATYCFKFVFKSNGRVGEKPKKKSKKTKLTQHSRYVKLGKLGTQPIFAYDPNCWGMMQPNLWRMMQPNFWGMIQPNFWGMIQLLAANY